MIRSRRSRAILGLGLALSLTAAACGDDAESAAEDTDVEEVSNDASSTTEAADDFPETITFAAVPSEESTALQESYAPVIAAIEQELGVEVEFVQATDYAGVIEGMIAGNVDVAQFGPFSYVLAKLNGAEIDAVAALIDEPGATPGYQSYGITQAGNDDINGLADYAGKDVCFVDPGSTSGFLYPSAGLIEEGVIASGSETDLAAALNPTFAGGHDASALAVANGDCDAGFAYDSMVDTQLIQDGSLEEGALKIVWKSEVIAGSPVAISTRLSDAFQEALARLLTEDVNGPRLVELGICDSADDCGVSDEDSWGYAAVDDSFYDGVRAVCELTKSPQCES